ncbi:MAG: hypothetical protein M3Z17_05270 [Gemmatimonadota bacterium]|nr:hypothetical protein [Gemmatimonadota bacterium]
MATSNFTFAQDQATRDAISQQVRDQINAAREGALAAAKDARAAGVPSPPPVPGSEGGTVQQIPWNPNDDVPPRAMGLGIAFIVAAAAVLIFMPFTRALARAIDRSKTRASVPAEVTTQLTQLAQAVDAIAVEVERISEGQRFTTKLLADQREQPRTILSPVAGERSAGT